MGWGSSGAGDGGLEAEAIGEGGRDAAAEVLEHRLAEGAGGRVVADEAEARGGAPGEEELRGGVEVLDTLEVLELAEEEDGGGRFRWRGGFGAAELLDEAVDVDGEADDDRGRE